MTPSPLIPRWAVVLVTFLLVGAVCFAIYQRDYKTAMVAILPVLFVLGADLGGLVRAWRGIPTPPTDPPPTPMTLEKDPP